MSWTVIKEDQSIQNQMTATNTRACVEVDLLLC